MQAPALIAAARAVLERWHSPAWEWRRQGPTADLMASLEAAVLSADISAAAPQEPAQEPSHSSSAPRILVDRALLGQALSDICAARLCEVNSMSSRHEMVRLMIRATDALRAALEQEEREPVAWYDGRKIYGSQEAASLDCANMAALMPLDTTPPRREWQGLTLLERSQIMADVTANGNVGIDLLICAFEDALRRKNT